MSKYTDLCKAMDAAGGYMSDAIGKCLRDLHRSGSGRSRIDLYLSESETYAAFKRGDNLARRFNASRAIPAFLVWDDAQDVKRKILPMPVSVDWESGVIRQREDNAFGLLGDLAKALRSKDAEGQLIPLTAPPPVAP